MKNRPLITQAVSTQAVSGYLILGMLLAELELFTDYILQMPGRYWWVLRRSCSILM